MYVIIMREGEDLNDIAVLPTMGEDGYEIAAMFKTSTMARELLQDIYGMDGQDMENEGVEIWHVH
jgi:hypothetical protein